MYHQRPTPNAFSLKQDPIFTYNGLCFILSEPSRFDTQRLISAKAGEFFDDVLKQVGTTRFHSQIKLLEDPSPFREGTKVVILLGARAQRAYIPQLSLNEARGYCYHQVGPVYLSTYAPQDCMDRRDYSQGEDDDEENENDIESGKEKDHSPTRRKNWKYWFAKDISKAFYIARDGYFPKIKSSKFLTYLPLEEVLNKLDSLINETIYFDIETNENFRITVFSFSTDASNIWTVPIHRYNKQLAYGEMGTCRILRALARLFAKNRICIHNSLFDLFILCWRYKIPPPKSENIIDTMVQVHRLSPETEKSLGHCGSYLTHEEYHKNENIFNPKNAEQELQLWKYNGKDVALLALIHEGLSKEIAQRNLQSSIDRATKLIRPYLLQSLQGINVDLEFKNKYFDELERKKVQFFRIIKILIGYDIEKLGWQRVAKYLYEFKRLPKPTPVFKNGEMKYEELTASATLYKLRTRFNVPFIDVVLHYRAIGKESGFLKFNCWTPINNQFQGVSNASRFTSADTITGTNTYRNASRMLFDFWGSNKQNVKKYLRRVGIADAGKALVQTDQSGAEAYVVAYLAPKGRYRILLEKGIKLYNFVAMHIFRKVWEEKLGRDLQPFIEASVEDLDKIEGWKELNKLIKSSDDWPASIRYYFICKMVVLAANYGMKGSTFQTNMLKKSEGTVIISKQQADFYLKFFHDLFPEIHQWHLLTQLALVNNKMTLKNLFGDERKFNGHFDESLWKEAYAFIPQSTVGMLTNLAIAELQEMIDNDVEEVRGMEIDILSNQHDAILSQCKAEHAGKLARIQERLLGKTFLIGTENQFTMRSESNIGTNWAFK